MKQITQEQHKASLAPCSNSKCNSCFNMKLLKDRWMTSTASRKLINGKEGATQFCTSSATAWMCKLKPSWCAGGWFWLRKNGCKEEMDFVEPYPEDLKPVHTQVTAQCSQTKETRRFLVKFLLIWENDKRKHLCLVSQNERSNEWHFSSSIFTENMGKNESLNQSLLTL